MSPIGTAARPSICGSWWGLGGFAVTDEPIDLDGRRTEAGRNVTEMRRRSANDAPYLVPLEQPHLHRLEDRMSVEPARTRVEAMAKLRFLLERYSATSAARVERIRKLIRRAIGDIEALRTREQR